MSNKSPEELILLELVNGICRKTEYYAIDEKVQLILMNNGCKSSDRPTIYQANITDTVCIDFIDGMIGNDKLKYYDAYKLDGKIHLVIFLPEFEIKQYNEDDLFGNSAVFYRIMNIYEMANHLVYKGPMIDAFLQTSAGISMRYTRVVVAYLVLKQFGQVTDADVEGCGLSSKEISDMISKCGISNILSGIRVVE